MEARSLVRGLPWLLGAVLLAALAALVAGGVAERRTLASERAEVAQDARLRAALLDSEIERFRLLPLALADDRDVLAALAGASHVGRPLDRKLEALARTTGAPVIYVVRPDGRTIAASNWRTPQSFVGMDYRFRSYFQRARLAGEGSQYAMGTVSGRPGLYLARRSRGGGVIVIKLEFDRIERAWERSGGITIVRNRNSIVVVTSRPAWRFATSGALAPADLDRFRTEARVPAAALSSLPLQSARNREFRLPGTRERYVASGVAVAQAGWRLTQLRRVDRAVASARFAASSAAAVMAVALVAIAWALRQRVLVTRRRTNELERAVAERTADLRREAEERTQLEARAAELRDSLRQANRLASLGQITASVAHETAQPVAAIRTYAQTSTTLLDRGDAEEVRTNLAAIARLADRVGAVTSQLRAFSRRRAGELRPVRLDEVIEGALLILREQLRDARLDLPDTDDVTVIGGKVRFEQVLVNLIQNALEATAGRPLRCITLTLASDVEHVRLRVADDGPGIAPEIADRLFTPFTTSRDQGLGLGLVIAQDIMAELGGWLRLVPSDVGACFEIGMRRA
jgi:two-component system C4-dicarboxylate transport sensor histidine kinase DctB